MKVASFFLYLMIIGFDTFGQTNTFPLNGQVGIGTLSPVAPLHVRDSSLNTGVIQLGGTLFYSQLRTDATLGGLRIINNWGAANSGIITFENGTGPTERMRIDNNGYVGIGNSNPAALLHVRDGNSLNSGTFQLGGTSYYSQFKTDPILGGLRIINNWGAANSGIITFENGTGPIERMRINDNGNVGIGTNSPTEKLSVVGNAFVNGNISATGNIKTKKIIVTQSVWPDYVFGRKYKLRSLATLESFINKNKHLPEMPSAKEVEEKGISVGDNQALLLKKIEELTLYIIMQNKRIDAIEKTNRRN